MSFKKTSKKAFTLIELSIVLIIIGLLIVAITSGSSLIRNAKLRSITNEAKQYQVAVNSFYMKFDEYPGDFDQILPDVGGVAPVAGDNDDIIEWSTAGVNEGSNAWLQLVASKILPSDVASGMAISEMLNPARADTITPTKHFPASAENAAGWIFNAYEQNGIKTNYVQLVKSFSPSYSTASLDAPIGATSVAVPAGEGGALTVSDAFSIDNKNDDGVRTSGDIREVFVLSSTANADCQLGEPTSDADGKYELTNGSENVCSLAFKVTIN